MVLLGLAVPPNIRLRVPPYVVDVAHCFSDGRDLVAGVLDCEMLSLQGGLSD